MTTLKLTFRGASWRSGPCAPDDTCKELGEGGLHESHIALCGQYYTHLPIYLLHDDGRSRLSTRGFSDEQSYIFHHGVLARLASSNGCRIGKCGTQGSDLAECQWDS